MRDCIIWLSKLSCLGPAKNCNKLNWIRTLNSSYVSSSTFILKVCFISHISSDKRNTELLQSFIDSQWLWKHLKKRLSGLFFFKTKEIVCTGKNNVKKNMSNKKSEPLLLSHALFLQYLLDFHFDQKFFHFFPLLITGFLLLSLPVFYWFVGMSNLWNLNDFRLHKRSSLSNSHTKIMWKFPSSMQEMSLYITVADKIFGKMYLTFYIRQANFN